MIINSNKSQILDFLVDAANVKGDCDSVYFPTTAQEISEILIEANKKKTKVTIAGNGTGLTGGRVPQGGIVISMAKFTNFEIDESHKIARVEAGVLLSEIKSKVEEKNLFYPPDPTENNCFLGGTIATNASGAKSFKYGSTRNFINSIEIVLPNGEIFEICRGENFAVDGKLKIGDFEINLPKIQMPKVKHAAGFYIQKEMDLIDLFIGSEGTLGIITEAEIRLIEKSENYFSAVLFFDDEVKSLEFVAEIREKSVRNRNLDDEINALAIEYFDFFALQFLKKEFPQIKNHHKAAVWIEQEINSANEEIIAGKWFDIIGLFAADLENSWIATDIKTRREFQDFRHTISWKISEYIARKNFRKIGTDTAVPNDKFVAFYNYSRSLVESKNIHFVSYGHFGDSHLHLNMLPENEDEYINSKEIYKQICQKAVDFGGTVSAEHGIGKLKREIFELMFSDEEIREMAKIKKLLDKNLILNFGNIFSERFFN